MATFVWLCGFDPRTLRSTDLPATLVEAPLLHLRLSLAGVPTLPATDAGLRGHDAFASGSGDAFAINGLLRVRRGAAWAGSGNLQAKCNTNSLVANPTHTQLSWSRLSLSNSR